MKHVFISYVRENKEIVDWFCKELESYGIKVWLDRNDIDPGTFWEEAIRKAIQEGAFFIACFSKEYSDRRKTYMNEEITLAIKELRLRHTDQAWFIPVKLNECEIPDRGFGAAIPADVLENTHCTDRHRGLSLRLIGETTDPLRRIARLPSPLLYLASVAFPFKIHSLLSYSKTARIRLSDDPIPRFP